MARKTEELLTAQLHAAEEQALLQWRSMVRDHQAGRAVDIGKLTTLASLLVLNDPVIAFSNDVDALAEAAALEDRIAAEQAEYASLVAESAAAEAAIWDLRAEVARLERVIAAPQYAAHGLAAIRSQLANIKEGHPRLWCEMVAAEARPDGVRPSLAAAWAEHRKRPQPLATASAEFEDD